MNRKRISDELQKRIDAHIRDGGDRSDPTFRRIVGLVRRMRRTVLERKYGTNPIRLEREILAPMRRRLDSIRMVALDTEWSPGDNPFDEMGIAVWDGRRIVEVLNIRTTPPRRPNRTVIGTPMRTTVDEALSVLSERLAGADALVMHAGRNDRIRLRMAGYELPRMTIFDTLTWHRMATGERAPASLGAICDARSIPHRSRHVASNDALATLRVVLSMIRHGPRPTSRSFSDPALAYPFGDAMASTLDRSMIG